MCKKQIPFGNDRKKSKNKRKRSRDIGKNYKRLYTAFGAKYPRRLTTTCEA
jgi:hypothetical protein